MFKLASDSVPISEYIGIETIEKVSDEDIFSLIFGSTPELGILYTSPFRIDSTPRCWFEYYNEKLRFNDFGNPEIINGIKMRSITALDAVRVYFNLSLQEAIKFILNNTTEGIKIIDRTSQCPKEVKKDVEILIKRRDFGKRDKKFWSKFGISSQNLIDDKVVAFDQVQLLNTRKGDFEFRVYDIGYAYTDFKDSRKKLYFPNREKRKKFISNLCPNDIGGFYQLDYLVDKLVITKAYKDWRVLKNCGVKNVVWTQNESAIPSDQKLINFLTMAKEIVVFYDNDEAGIKGAKVLKDKFDSFQPNKTSYLYLNDYSIKDPSDLIKEKGKQELINFLNLKNLL